MKVENLDFIIYEDDDEKIVFRFYPQESNCHSFNAKPPTKWEEVYKVYYSYKVLRIWKDEDDEIDVLFDSICDECSVIDEVAERIKYIIEDKEIVIIEREGKKYTINLLNEEIMDFADCVTWIIKKTIGQYYEIILWNNDNIGYRIYLKKEQLKEFGKYLEDCCEYMLKHGEPI